MIFKKCSPATSDHHFNYDLVISPVMWSVLPYKLKEIIELVISLFCFSRIHWLAYSRAIRIYTKDVYIAISLNIFEKIATVL